MKSSIEVVICTYNGADYVVEQLQSIVRQTRTVDKISIYDDRSSDQTLRRIHEYVNSLPANELGRFSIHVNASNVGYANNFSGAIASATEDVIFLCDQDDIWEPEKVAVLLDVMGEQGVDMVFSDGMLINYAGRRIGTATVLGSYGLTHHAVLKFRENAVDFLVRRNYINGAASAIRREAAQQALPLPCDMPHDYWLAIWCSVHSGVAATPSTLYRYRQHRNNVIGVGSGNSLYTWMGLWRQPDIPRERELRILKAVTSRIALLSDDDFNKFNQKVQWLSRVVTTEKKALSRVLAIFQSALNGSYRRYSDRYGFFRDVISLIK